MDALWMCATGSTAHVTRHQRTSAIHGSTHSQCYHEW